MIAEIMILSMTLALLGVLIHSVALWRVKRNHEEVADILQDAQRRIEQMEQDLNRQLKVPSFPGSALTGKGVGKTLNACLKLLLKSLQKELNLGG